MPFDCIRGVHIAQPDTRAYIDGVQVVPSLDTCKSGKMKYTSDMEAYNNNKEQRRDPLEMTAQEAHEFVGMCFIFLIAMTVLFVAGAIWIAL